MGNASLTTRAINLCRERVQRRGPAIVQLRRPLHQRCQGCGVELIQPLPSSHLIYNEAALAQHSEVATHGGTADVEAAGDVTRGHYLVPQQNQNLPPDRIRDRKRDVHEEYVTTQLHIVKRAKAVNP